MHPVAALLSILALAVVPSMVMKLASPAFKHEAGIPAGYTCDGADISPPLAWSDAPAGTRSFALVVTDPDAPDPKAPKTTWVHWVLYDIPAGVAGLGEGSSTKGFPPGTLSGTNDWGRTGYGGPCPPIGRHRYVHTLYALDTVLADLERPTRAKLLAAMQGHVLQTAELIGTYKRP